MVATDRNSPSHRLTSPTTVDFPEPSEPTTPMTAPPERSACGGVPPPSVRHVLRHARPLRARVALERANRRQGLSRDASARPRRQRPTPHRPDPLAYRRFV